MSSKSVVTTTVGYMCIGLTLWMLSMPRAAWFDHPAHPLGLALLFPFAIILGVMGILAFQNERVLDSVIFFGGAGLFWATHAHHLGMFAHAFLSHGPAAHDAVHQGADASAVHHGMAPGGGRAGWYFLIWAVFFCYVWIGSFKAGLGRFLFLLGFWLTPLAIAIGAWIGSHFFMVLGGYLGLVTAILALIVSASAIICHGSGSAASGVPKAG